MKFVNTHLPDKSKYFYPLSGIAVLVLVVFASISIFAKTAGAETIYVSGPTPPIIYQPISGPGTQKGLTPNIVSGAFTPTDIRAAYNFGNLSSNSSQHIAIIDAYGDPSLSTDIALFDTTFNLPAITPTIYYPDGSPLGSDPNWAIETAMDVEWAHACAPNAAIDLIIAPDATFTHLLNAINKAVSLKTVNSYNIVAISMSFGAPEINVNSIIFNEYEAAFTTAVTAGIQLIASSGDHGANAGTTQLTPEYPASSPQVIGVGGTSLTLAAGSYGNETAWNLSGGGYSTYFSEPSFQTAAAIPDATSKRAVPDVSLDANPNTGVNVLYGGTWYEVGGTSLSAPIWAAVVADNAAVNSGRPITLTSLYSVYGVGANGVLYPNETHDITSGNNGGYSAGTGWDAVTGIGSPNVTKLLLSPIITSASALPGGEATAHYTTTLAASGGSGVYTNWTVTTGSLPSGLILHPGTGVIDGTPTTVSNPTFTVQVTDSAGGTGLKVFTLNVIAGPAITSASPPAWDKDVAGYSFTITGAGGTGSLAFSAPGLPPGLTITPAGLVSGTPVSTGVFPGTFTVTDSLGGTGTQAFSISINLQPSITSTSILPGGEATAPYNLPFTASGGSAPFTWSVAVGSLPSGLTLHAGTGIIDGIPAAVSNPSFTIKLTDNAGVSTTKIFSINVISGPSITSASPLPGGETTAPYTTALGASGGSNVYSNWSITTGSLPSGLTLHAGTGVIDGTPTGVSNPTFTVQVADSTGGVSSKIFTLNVIAGPSITMDSTLTRGILDVPYAAALSTSGGSGVYTNWMVTAGSLPAGLILHPGTGVIDGTPTAVSKPTFTVQVTDSAGGTGLKVFTLNVIAGPAVTSASPPAWDKDVAGYSFTVTGAGGTGTLSFSATGLPPGLTMTLAGLISGTPNSNGVFPGTFTVTDSVGGTGTQAFSISINLQPSITSTSTLPGGEATAPYNTPLAVTGGTSPLTWSVTLGSLPTGLTLHGVTGIIDGTPTTISNPTFTLQVTDSAGVSVTKIFTLNVTAGPSIASASPLHGKIGVAYSQTIDVSGGSAPFTWSITSGSLPAGLSLNSATGTITGKPTAITSHSSITLKVIDAAGGNDSKILNIAIRSANAPADFDGDAKTDIGVYRPSIGYWFILKSDGTGAIVQNWGIPGDIPVTGDFDGDGMTDIGVYRPSTGFWFIFKSDGTGAIVQNWGIPGDIPVTGDFDGDGKTDIGVYRPSTGFWFIFKSDGTGAIVQNWGFPDDVPDVGDFDGDGKTDIGVYRPSIGYWFILKSDGTGAIVQNWGIPGDIPVTGDFDGDGKTDIGVYRPSIGYWFILKSDGTGAIVQNWGIPGDIPVTGDFDGDGMTDIGVYRPSTGFWFIFKSDGTGAIVQNWGIINDILT